MEQTAPSNNNQRNLIAIIVILAMTIFAYHMLKTNAVMHTSLLFIGLPALISIAIIKFTKPTSAYGIMFKVVTLFLLISGMFLGEGFACILFAAPIFYLVGFVLVGISEFLGRNDKDNLYMLVALPVLLIMGEANQYNSSPELQTVEVTQIVDGNVTVDHFNKQNILQQELPHFFSLGFPIPTQMTGDGIELGATRQIDFESSTRGLGTVVFEVVERRPDKIVFQKKSDDTHINRWLDWDRVEITFERKKEQVTEITWRSSYYCELSPSWYFQPLEKLAVQKSTQYLIEAYFSRDDG